MPRKKPATVTPDWNAYTVERWSVDRLQPFKKNARTHGTEQIKQLRASLREFGWTVPILVREDGTIIAGHGRVMAAKAEGVRLHGDQGL